MVAHDMVKVYESCFIFQYISLTASGDRNIVSRGFPDETPSQFSGHNELISKFQFHMPEKLHYLLNILLENTKLKPLM